MKILGLILFHLIIVLMMGCREVGDNEINLTNNFMKQQQIDSLSLVFSSPHLDEFDSFISFCQYDNGGFGMDNNRPAFYEYRNMKILIGKVNGSFYIGYAITLREDTNYYSPLKDRNEASKMPNNAKANMEGNVQHFPANYFRLTKTLSLFCKVNSEIDSLFILFAQNKEKIQDADLRLYDDSGLRMIYCDGNKIYKFDYSHLAPGADNDLILSMASSVLDLSVLDRLLFLNNDSDAFPLKDMLEYRRARTFYEYNNRKNQ